MRPALGYKAVEHLKRWQQIPNGDALLFAESEFITDRLRYCFGQYLLKNGPLAAVIDTHTSTIQTQVNFCNYHCQSGHTGIIGEHDDLPFGQNTIDAILMTHVLEYSSDPHQVLREAHRVLMPNGNLIISIFNPLSFLSILRFVPGFRFKDFKRGRFFSIARIKDWLNLLGFEVTKEHTIYYSSALKKHSELDTSLTSRIFKQLFPWCGGVTMIVAKKREWPLTPIRPRMRYKSVFNPAVRARSVNRQL